MACLLPPGILKPAMTRSSKKCDRSAGVSEEGCAVVEYAADGRRRDSGGIELRGNEDDKEQAGKQWRVMAENDGR